MLIAREKRRVNIAEYILYMWQIEDLLRACNFNQEMIKEKLVCRFQVTDEVASEIADWYTNLALMMCNEHVKEKGHIQVISNLVNDLNEFHLKLLEIGSDEKYVRLYQSNREAINEFMQKSDFENEIDACFNALYGVLVLKLKNVEISVLTNETIAEFSQMIGHLSARYIQFENDLFEF